MFLGSSNPELHATLVQFLNVIISESGWRGRHFPVVRLGCKLSDMCIHDNACQGRGSSRGGKLGNGGENL